MIKVFSTKKTYTFNNWYQDSTKWHKIEMMHIYDSSLEHFYMPMQNHKYKIKWLNVWIMQSKVKECFKFKDIHHHSLSTVFINSRRQNYIITILLKLLCLNFYKKNKIFIISTEFILVLLRRLLVSSNFN